MRKNTKEIGDRGEEQAKAHLLENGYLLLETNWRHKKYELDIIAKKRFQDFNNNYNICNCNFIN